MSLSKLFLGRDAGSSAMLACVCGSAIGLASAVALASPPTCLMLTGRQAPGAPAGAVFASLDQPAITTTAGIVFRGGLAVGSGGVTSSNDTGIWRLTPGGAWQLIAREGTGAESMPGMTLVELGQPIPDATGDLLGYWARIQGAGVTSATDRVFLVHDGIVNPEQFRSGDAIFGTPIGALSEFDEMRDRPCMNNGGLGAFRGTLQTNPDVAADQVAGIFAIDLNTESVIIAQQGTACQYNPAFLYENTFSMPVRNNIGDLAFRATLRRGVGGITDQNDQIIMFRTGSDGVYFRAARTSEVVGHGITAVFDALGDPTITEEPRIAFSGRLRQGVGGVTDQNDVGLFSICPCGSLQQNAIEGATAVGIPGAVFADFSEAMWSKDGRLMFGAQLRGPNITASNDTSIWWVEIPFGFVPVAREGSEAPGTGGATFADFGIHSSSFWIASTLGNQLVFSGVTSTGVHGLWVFTPYRGLTALVLEGQSVSVAAGDTRQIVSLTPVTDGYAGTGRRSLLSDERKLLFRATVTGGATGLFSVDLPPYQLGCLSDWDNSGDVNSADFFAFLTDFFAGAADANNSGSTDSQDFFDFLNAFFAGC